jgi:hypothetical protein
LSSQPIMHSQPTVADVEGNINNYIDVTDFQPYKVIDDEEGPQGDLKKSAYACSVSSYRIC